MRQFVVDAFAEAVFTGNPAAVCVAAEWPAPELMAKIAVENNLSETAFLVGQGGRYGLRWFTPGGEVDLCGHATLASAFVVMNFVEPGCPQVTFTTQSSGELTVRREGDLYSMDFPAYELRPVPVVPAMGEALGAEPTEAFMGRDLLCIFEDEDFVRAARPDMGKVMELEGLLCHISAPGRDVDCVSRSFAPKLRIEEDPVCGSGHCHIVPYWQKTLGKDKITAYQASRRGGTLYCESGEAGRLVLAGRAALFAKAELFVG